MAGDDSLPTVETKTFLIERGYGTCKNEGNERSGSAFTPADTTLHRQETLKVEAIAALIGFSFPIRGPRFLCRGMFELQSINPDFLGRDQILQQLHKVLQPPRQQSMYNVASLLRSVSLCGFGGVSKTQIAIQYAYSSMHEY